MDALIAWFRAYTLPRIDQLKALYAERTLIGLTLGVGEIRPS